MQARAAGRRVILLLVWRSAAPAADKKKPIMDCHIGTLTKRINTVCEKAKLPLVGLHGLRHSFASLSASLRIPEHITMQIGGWSDPTVMRKIYTHVATMDIAKTQNQLTDFFNTNCLQNA